MGDYGKKWRSEPNASIYYGEFLVRKQGVVELYRDEMRAILLLIVYFLSVFSFEKVRPVQLSSCPYKFIEGPSPTFYMEGVYHSPRQLARWLDQVKSMNKYQDIDIGYIVLTGRNANIPAALFFLGEVKRLMKERGVYFIIYGDLYGETQVETVRW
jgi:hypothetical protein